MPYVRITKTFVVGLVQYNATTKGDYMDIITCSTSPISLGIVVSVFVYHNQSLPLLKFAKEDKLL